MGTECAGENKAQTINDPHRSAGLVMRTCVCGQNIHCWVGTNFNVILLYTNNFCFVQKLCTIIHCEVHSTV